MLAVHGHHGPKGTKKDKGKMWATLIGQYCNPQWANVFSVKCVAWDVMKKKLHAEPQVNQITFWFLKYEYW